MIHDLAMRAYWLLPVSLQEIGLSLYARRLDGVYYRDGYEDWLEEFTVWKDWPREKIEDWQNQQLLRIVELAATRVPYYQERWRGLDWRSIRFPCDLSVIPLLDKHSIRQNERAFVAEGLNPKSLWMEKTSGTTGTSLKIFWSLSTLPKWAALKDATIRKPVGVGYGQPRAMIGGRPVVPGDTNMPPYWRYNRRWKQLYLSSYHISQKTAPAYVRAIQEYGAEWITGYGSAIAALAELALDDGLSNVGLRSAIASGDTLLAGMRSSIEQFFKCKCFDHYGQTEGVAMAMECASGRLHILPFMGIWEILRPDGAPCEPGEVGEIVATGLLNDAMPLVRYRLGDYAAWAPSSHARVETVSRSSRTSKAARTTT
jgi:phenylacetate-CoA ligase